MLSFIKLQELVHMSFIYRVTKAYNKMGSEYLRMEKFQKVCATSNFLWFSTSVSGEAVLRLQPWLCVLLLFVFPSDLLSKGCGTKPKPREAVRVENLFYYYKSWIVSIEIHYSIQLGAIYYKLLSSSSNPNFLPVPNMNWRSLSLSLLSHQWRSQVISLQFPPSVDPKVRWHSLQSAS